MRTSLDLPPLSLVRRSAAVASDYLRHRHPAMLAPPLWLWVWRIVRQPRPECSSGIDFMSAHEVGSVLSHDLTEIADLIWRLRRQSIDWSRRKFVASAD